MDSRTLFLLIILLHNVSAFATNYYVSNSGNNINNGLSLGNAFATIQFPIDQNILSAGDTVFVANGVYAGFDNRNTSGTSAQPLVFKALGTNVQITSSGPLRNDGINIEGVDYNVIDGFISNGMIGNGNGIRLVLSNHSVVRNCITRNNAERGIFTGFTDDILIEKNICSGSVDEHGIYVSNSSDRAIIRFNICHDNNATGIHCNADLSSGGDGISDDFQIYGNILYDNNTAAGINMDGIRNAEVYNNLIYNNHNAQGISLFQIDGAVPSTGARIHNNTIIVPPDGRWGILFINGAHAGAEVYNNIILSEHSSRGSISTTSTSNFTSDYNLLVDVMNQIDDDPGNAVTLAQWQEATGQDQHSILAASFSDIFVDFANDDFDLAGGSQASNTGTSLADAVTRTDLSNRLRPGGIAYDIGAYETDGIQLNCSNGSLNISNPILANQYGISDNILSDASVDRNLIFLAKKSVQLLPSFSVLSPYTFQIEILPCKE